MLKPFYVLIKSFETEKIIIKSYPDLNTMLEELLSSEVINMEYSSFEIYFCNLLVPVQFYRKVINYSTNRNFITTKDSRYNLILNLETIDYRNYAIELLREMYNSWTNYFNEQPKYKFKVILSEDITLDF